MVVSVTTDPLPGLLPKGRGGVHGVNRGSPPILRSSAKTLRGNMTEVEKTLWHHLRAQRFERYKFRRQHPLGAYIVDFVCLKQKLIIELDGGQHSAEHDAKRTKDLQILGFRLLRFWNNDITGNLEGVLETIHKHLADPLSRQGEG